MCQNDMTGCKQPLTASEQGNHVVIWALDSPVIEREVNDVDAKYCSNFSVFKSLLNNLARRPARSPSLYPAAWSDTCSPDGWCASLFRV
jgi:hypothetical protein